jgi:DNA-binding transcriptional regulator YdaS (Cro superfamily)
MGRKPKTKSYKLKALGMYLEDKSHTDFVKAIEISNGHLSLILTGKRKASLKLANRIIQHTDEEVTLNDLRPDIVKDVMKYAEKRQEEV